MVKVVPKHRATASKVSKGVWGFPTKFAHWVVKGEVVGATGGAPTIEPGTKNTKPERRWHVA